MTNLEPMIVRRFGSSVNHLAEIDRSWIKEAECFGSLYRSIPKTVNALCGAKLRPDSRGLIVMSETKIICSNCKIVARETHLTELNSDMLLDSKILTEIRDSLDYIHSVGPSSWKTLVEEGSGGEEHNINGDDLSGFCWHLNRLMALFAVEPHVGDWNDFV
jgi:hypothetical protein